jgi:hypothetical protein
MARLRRSPAGRIEISVSHPECNKVTIPFNAPREHEISPSSIVLFGAEPNEPVIREVTVFSNYGEEFEIDEVSKKRCCITKVLSREKVEGGYKLELEITPPKREGNKVFKDVLYVKIKDGETLELGCRGFYARK